jgi:hypothetical protein
MNSLAFVSSSAAIASAAAAAVGVWFAFRSFHRSAELQAFLALTTRYEQIMNEIPARLTKDWGEDEDPHLAIRLRYLNLCAEEFCLKEKRLLSATVWGIWEAEMRTTLASPPYARAWPTLSCEFDCYPQFQAFVNDAMDEVNGEPGSFDPPTVMQSPHVHSSPLIPAARRPQR